VVQNEAVHHGNAQAACRLPIPRVGRLRKSFPHLAACLALAIAALLLTDLSLFFQRSEFGREEAQLRDSLTQTENRRLHAEEATERNLLARNAALARREAGSSRELHLAIDRGKGLMYLEREGARLRVMPVRLDPQGGVDGRPGAEPPAGKRRVLRVLDENSLRDLPQPAVLASGKPVSGNRALPGALGPLAIMLDDGAVIYAPPPAGAAADPVPGGIRAETSDLAAVWADLQPGMTVYFY
jgi:hypothetical protein